MSDKQTKTMRLRIKAIKAKCMNCGHHAKITYKDQPSPVCALCGSLAWMERKVK